MTMPILEISSTTLTQECLARGSVHTLPIQSGVSKSKKETYALADGDDLQVKVDGQATAQVVTFAAADFATIAAATAAEVVAKLNAKLTGATTDVDNSAVRIVSASGARGTSSIEVSGGSARDKLGFDGRKYGARVLGVTIGSQTAPDTIDLPHCPDCGAKECLMRTWDTMPASHANTTQAQHRKVVNAFAQHLRGIGFSDADAKVLHDKETAAPPDIDTTALSTSPRTLASVRPVTRAVRGGTP
jgi:predicted nucleic acid-binding Zn ribbon protein